MHAPGFFVCIALVGAWCNAYAQGDYRPSGAVPNKATYVFAPHPNLNPQAIYGAYQPVVSYLERKIPGVQFTIEASKDYAEFESKLAARRFQFAIPNPYQTTLGFSHGYRVIAKMAPDDEFRGLMLVRADSPFRKPGDLAGKKLCFISASAVAATMLPRMYLQEHGVSPKAADVEYVGSAFSAITHVFDGEVPACGVALRQWRAWSLQNPDKVRSLRILFQTPTMPHNSVVARDDVPSDVAQQVAAALINMDKDKDLDQTVFKFDQNHYEAATNSTYMPFLSFLEKYERTLGLPQEISLPH